MKPELKKEFKELTENSQCRLCKEQQETAQHLLAGCKMFAYSEYLARHNKTLMVMAVAWAKEQNLLDQNVKWYQEKRNRGHLSENSQAKLVWEFQFNLRKTELSRRQDLMLEEKQTKNIGYAIWHTHKRTIWKKRLEKRANYR